MSDRALHLYEQMLLLALDDERGTVFFGTSSEHALAGAMLAELVLDGHLRLDGEGKAAKVLVGPEASTGDALLDEAIALVAADSRPRAVTHWATKFAAVKKLKHRAATALVDRGILRATQDRVLFVFERTRYPEKDRRPEQQLIHEIKTVLLGSGRNVDPRTVTLIALAHRTGVLRRVMDKHLLRERSERLEKLASGDLAASAASEALAAMQAAVTVATIVPTTTPS